MIPDTFRKKRLPKIKSFSRYLPAKETAQNRMTVLHEAIERDKVRRASVALGVDPAELAAMVSASKERSASKELQDMEGGAPKGESTRKSRQTV